MYKHHDRLAEATALLERTLADRERTAGPLAWATEMARQKVAHIYQDAGRNEDLIALYARPVVETDQELGPDHPTSIAARRNMVTAYRMCGRKDEVLLILEQVTADYVRVLGPDDPQSLSARMDLGHAYTLAERRVQAIDLFEGLVADLERIHGVGHPETAMALNRLFQAYDAAGRTDDAAAILARTTDVRGTDPLTGLPGRHGLEEGIQLALDALPVDGDLSSCGAAEDNGAGIAVAILDLDDLKIQNDRHGHAFGDVILTTVAERLEAVVTPPGTLWSDSAAPNLLSSSVAPKGRPKSTPWPDGSSPPSVSRSAPTTARSG